MTSRIVLEYDGTRFSGWAHQPGKRTVADELTRAMAVLMKREPRIVVAGRTDSGVHALGQVVSYEGDPLPLRSLNALLPPDVAALACEAAPDGFHARFDASSRTYLYRLHTRRYKESPFLRRRALWWPHGVDFDALQACAAVLEGEHDFTAFTPTQSAHRTFRRTILAAGWREIDEGFEFRIEANAFLRSMNRVLVATMLEVSSGRRSLRDFTALLGGAPRSAAAPTAPAHGLYLASVRYDRGTPNPMTDLGDPSSYLEMERGVPVLSSDRQVIGRLEHVLADAESDIFDGVIVDLRGGAGGWRFADASVVRSLHQRGVVLSLDAAACAELPEPRENPAVIEANPDDVTPDTVRDRLRRAWDYLSGNY